MAVAHGGRPGDRAGAYATSSVAQMAALAFGVVFLLVGIAGFIPGITTDYDELTWTGTDSQAELFGLFQVSVLHNAVHLLFGVLGIWAARAWDLARAYLLASGVVYIALFVFGMVIDRDTDTNFIPVNAADDWLHLGLGVSLLLLGLAAGTLVDRERDRDHRARPTREA